MGLKIPGRRGSAMRCRTWSGIDVDCGMISPIILGASGRVGRMVCRAWPEDVPPPVPVGRRAGAVRWDMAGPPPPLAGAEGAAVIVLAGVTPHGDGDLAGNAPLALAALAAARTWGARHLFVASSSSVYGETPAAGVDETARCAPAGPYGAEKLRMEAAVAEAAQGLGVTCLRVGNVAGAGAPFDTLAAGAERPWLHRFADGTGPSRSYVGPVTLAHCLAALCRLAAAGQPLPPVLNLAAPRPTAMADIYAARGRSFAWRPAPPDGLHRVHLDCTRLSALVPLPQNAGAAATLWAEVDRAA
ncbi:NAD-dependent epimerase/dehydratase family protein [Rhodobacteraceae bacterium CCMM004]|nr:NAD-dependent epimerase/dehydratase family protein [Rhodobacteraceae bacterium CCMM004]